MQELDKRGAIAAWELAERPFKLLVQGYMQEAVADAQANGIPVPEKYLKHLRLVKMAKLLAKRMDSGSLIKIPSTSTTIVMEQTPNEKNKRPWVIKLELVSETYKMDREVPEKFASVLVPADQAVAVEQFKVSLGKAYSAVTKIYDDLRHIHSDLLSNIGLLVNTTAGTYALVSPDFPKYKHDVHIGLTIRDSIPYDPLD